MNWKSTSLIAGLGALLLVAVCATESEQKEQVMNSPTPNTPASNAADEAAIRALRQQMVDGWNQGSGAGFAAPFAEDGEQIVFEGTHFKNKQEIASFHQQLFDKFMKGSRLVGEVKFIRFLTPDVAVMHSVGGTVMPGATETSAGRDSMQMYVVTKRDGQWRIKEFLNARMLTIEQQLFLDDFDSLPA